MHSSENALIVLPRLRVQNANCISSPLTWGFPSVTAFSGLMVALERRLGPEAGVKFSRFAMVCHDFQPQVNTGRYQTTFNLTRNPLGRDGETLGIVEEGRAHMEISLVFAVQYDEVQYLEESSEQALAQLVLRQVGAMRIAGGSVLSSTEPQSARTRPKLIRLAGEDWDKHWRHIRTSMLPGFALVMRNDLLEDAVLPSSTANSSLEKFHRFIRMSGRTFRAQANDENKDVPVGDKPKATWSIDSKSGWTVPIPIGFCALGPLHSAGSVANARDRTIPFRFVECIYSFGQWVSPHRLRSHEDMLWTTEKPTDAGLYLCRNGFVPLSTEIAPS